MAASKYLILSSLLTACGIAPQRSGLGSQMPLQVMPMATSNLTIHPFAGMSSLNSGTFELFASGRIEFADAVRQLVSDHLQNPYLQLHVDRAPLSTKMAAGGARYNVGLSVKGVPIFGAAAAAHQLADRQLYLLGTLPTLTASAVAAAPDTWPDLDQTKAKVLSQMAAPGADLDVSFGRESPYYVPTAHGALVSAWRLIATVGGLPYEAVADEQQVYSLTRHYFDVDGTALVFENNVNDKSMITYALKDLAADGTLTNTYVQTFLASPYTRVTQTNETFNFAATTSQYDEVASFCHTDDHLRWMFGLGALTYGNLPLHLELHQIIGDTTNNALFVPGDSSTNTPFRIRIGDGDGKVLQNLETDRDVPAHESGHYVIFNYLKATTGESLAIHEGLADALVFLQQNNPNLGKSICPASSSACIVPGQALRTADNAYAYGDQNWQDWTDQLGGTCCGHKHGQIISGLLWDLVKNKVMSAADAANLLLKSITYFKQDSGFRDYLLSILIADRELFACSYDTQIRQYITARNMASFISGVSPGCSNIPLPAGGQNLGTLNDPAAGAGSSSTGSSSKSNSTGGFLGTFCGVIAGGSSSHTNSLLTAFVLFFLGMLPALPLLKGARAKKPKRRR